VEKMVRPNFVRRFGSQLSERRPIIDQGLHVPGSADHFLKQPCNLSFLTIFV
jgi:hypothetical protein